MQHTWITLQLSQLSGPSLIKQLGHLVNNQSSSKDKCRLNGVSHTAVQRVKGNRYRCMTLGKKEVRCGGFFFFFLKNLANWVMLLQRSNLMAEIEQDISNVRTKSWSICPPLLHQQVAKKNEQGNAGRQVFCFDVFICLYSTYTTLKKTFSSCLKEKLMRALRGHIYTNGNLPS